ncbi:hypothetical protein [Polyangium sp. 6x1]|uniref:hypothetical protein n=1 Tax=Polyangium sp. 6x1 TaxID=3042689 RepID=UPI0024821E9F|nr:hypothetical protein [Polyangium sp. 6x1]
MGLCARLAGLCMALGVAGCGAATFGATVPLGYGSVYGYTVVDAGGVPYDIYNYPSYYWNGNYAYLVGSSWYYPYGGSWVVFEDEPWDLYQYRRSLPVQVAPPAVQYPAYPGYRSYPAYREPTYRAPPPDVQVAPPALRRPAEVAPPVQVAPPAYIERPTRVAPPVQVAPPAPRGETYRSLPRAPDVVDSPSPGRVRLPSAPPAPRGRAVQSAPPAPRR